MEHYGTPWKTTEHQWNARTRMNTTKKAWCSLFQKNVLPLFLNSTKNTS